MERQPIQSQSPHPCQRNYVKSLIMARNTRRQLPCQGSISGLRRVITNNTVPDDEDAKVEDDSVVVAIGETNPFILTPSEPSPSNITVGMHVSIPSLPESSTPLISSAHSHYLSAEPIPILISSPLFPSYTIPFLFPPPPERPQIIPT